jgi:hypothetical protein
MENRIHVPLTSAIDALSSTSPPPPRSFTPGKEPRHDTLDGRAGIVVKQKGKFSSLTHRRDELIKRNVWNMAGLSACLRQNEKCHLRLTVNT